MNGAVAADEINSGAAAIVFILMVALYCQN